MATSVQIPPSAAPYIEQLQELVNSFEGQLWAGSLAYCLGNLELGFLNAAYVCLEKLTFEFAASIDPTARPIIDATIALVGTLVEDLEYINAQIGAGIFDTAEAVDGLLELGLFAPAPQTKTSVQSFIQPYIAGGTMALSTLTTPPVCATRGPQHKGICCAAVTQLGATVAAIGFQYTSCTGRTVCMKCGIGQSVSVKHPGRSIFIPRRVQCGPSGCPALSQA